MIHRNYYQLLLIQIMMLMLAFLRTTGASYSRQIRPAFIAHHHQHQERQQHQVKQHDHHRYTNIRQALHSTTDKSTSDVADVDVGNAVDATKQKNDDGNNNNNNEADEATTYTPPWSTPIIASKKFNNSRFRQHVNPLARRYQMSAELPDNWPASVFTNVSRPMYLDIGCGKGGFLLELVGRRHGKQDEQQLEVSDAATTAAGAGAATTDDAEDDGATKKFKVIRDDSYMNSTKSYTDTTSDFLPPEMNYLGLEIRPGVSQYSQQRVTKRGLDGILSFVGCNANVDLDRLLSLYQDAINRSSSGDGDGDGGDDIQLSFVSIQFPDPHFKKSHVKRRVVTPALVKTLAKYMKEGDVVFLQSDIKDALEAMRDQFVEGVGLTYYNEWTGDGATATGGDEEYAMENPLGIPTEREVSVLKKGLPIYRTLFKRNKSPFDDSM